MDKGKRTKQERAAVFPLAVALPRASIEVLGEAVETVGDMFGTEPECAKAAALLWAIGDYLGYTLDVRPVSLIAHQASTENFVVMGPKAAAQIPESLLAGANYSLLEGENLGHVVLTCEEPRLLLDPTLRQLRNGSLNAPSLLAGIDSTHPDSGEWHVQIGDLEVRYLLDDDNRALLEGFDEAVDFYSATARNLGKGLRAGATASWIRQQTMDA